MILKPIKINEIFELQDIYLNSYTPIFSDHWDDDGMEIYLNRESDYNRLKSDIQNPFIEYYFIQQNKINVGIIKIKYQSSELFSELENCELEKIYILPEYSGKGLGRLAFSEIIKQTKKNGKKLVFLSVISSNKNAIGFYEKIGFEFDSKTQIDEPNFKEGLRDMDRMKIYLDR